MAEGGGKKEMIALVKMQTQELAFLKPDIP